jgi:hypothetical protein
MPHSPPKPDLGRANGMTPDRGAPSGHTPDDHAKPHRRQSRSKLPDHADETERARPHDTGRSGA